MAKHHRLRYVSLVALVQLDSVTLHLGKKRLFGELRLQIGASDRIGLVGPNGSGKTSLLRLIAGELEPDEGSVATKRSMSLGYLPQELEVRGGRTVLQTLLDAIPGRDGLEGRVADAERELASIELAPGLSDQEREARLVEASERLADLHERLATFERDYGEHSAQRILAGLGFAPGDAHRDLSELSGGWHARVALGATLFARPDLLLLDEPTNHLDMPSVAWLGAHLAGYRRAFILICHDREFLNEQIHRVVSFEPEGVRQYRGNFEHYVRTRAQEAEVLRARQQNLRRERERVQRFVDRFRAQATKARAVQSRVKKLEHMEEVTEIEEHQASTFRFLPTLRTSRQVLKVEGMSKRYGDQVVLDDVHLSVLRGERIGIIGKNGAGKTTLLRMLAGEARPDTGVIHYGHRVEVGYYAQHHRETLAANRTVFDQVAGQADGHSPTTIRTLLGTLGLCGDDVDKPVGVLSGGERARVALARLLITSCNLVFMDEPTNHLDLQSSERLADALASFDGALVFASHNKSFVRRLATRIWNVADQRVETFPGSLDEYLTSVLRRLDLPEESDSQSQDAGQTPMAVSKGHGRSAAKERRRREAAERTRRREVVGPLVQRVAELERRIEDLEAVQRERHEKLADPTFYDDAQKSAELSRQYQQDASLIEQLTSEWEIAEIERQRAIEAFDAKLRREQGTG